MTEKDLKVTNDMQLLRLQPKVLGGIRKDMESPSFGMRGMQKLGIKEMQNFWSLEKK
jgi:hypothetical protein